MKVKDILEKLKDIDPEMEVTTAISSECCGGDFAFTYGLDPYFNVETLCEYKDIIFTDEVDVKDRIARDFNLDDEVLIEKEFDVVPRNTKLVITVTP